VEAAGGRNRAREERHGPRTIDLDLLLYGQEIVDEPRVTVPHPRMHERPFVLEPLAEIAAGAVHPGLGMTIESLRDLLRGCHQTGFIRATAATLTLGLSLLCGCGAAEAQSPGGESRRSRPQADALLTRIAEAYRDVRPCRTS
jgi:hypothetical protein